MAHSTGGPDSRKRPPEGDLPPDLIRAVPLRHPGRWVATGIVLVCAAALAQSMATNPNMQWEVVGQYLLSRDILEGLVVTLELTALAMGVGIVLGVIVAVARQSANPILSSASWIYIWFFRGTPVLVQLIFWYNLALLFPRLGIGIPFGPTLLSADTNEVISPLMAAILGLGLNEAAYMAEIVRGGILAVEPGQAEAAQAFGMTRLQTMRRIILPQAMRVILPPTGNETIGMLKASSLASVVAVPELLQSASVIYSRTFQTIPLLLVASIWYLIVVTILSVGQAYVESYFGRGSGARGPTPTTLGRVFRALTRFHA